MGRTSGAGIRERNIEYSPLASQQRFQAGLLETQKFRGQLRIEEVLDLDPKGTAADPADGGVAPHGEDGVPDLSHQGRGAPGASSWWAITPPTTSAFEISSVPARVIGAVAPRIGITMNPQGTPASP